MLNDLADILKFVDELQGVLEEKEKDPKYSSSLCFQCRCDINSYRLSLVVVKNEIGRLRDGLKNEKKMLRILDNLEDELNCKKMTYIRLIKVYDFK